MAVLTPITLDEARAFVTQYPLGALTHFEGIPAGSVNSNFLAQCGENRLFLRVYEEQDAAGAALEAELLAHLAARGVPVASPLVSKGGARVLFLAEKPAALFPWREGRMRCQAAVTAEDARRVGVALAKVHAAGEGGPLPRGRFEVKDLFLRLDRIAEASDPVLAAQAAPLRRMLETIERRPLPRGLVHGDLFRDNVLWDEQGNISVLLDFESASEGVYAYDLMVTVLAWCVGDRLDLGLARAMIAGYRSVRPLTDEEIEALPLEGQAAALRFTITRITDYAMRVTEGPRVIKDWRRFAMRLSAMESLGHAELLGLGP